MKNFKLISKDGDFLPLLYRIQQEGHGVGVFIQAKDSKMYDGLLKKSKGAIELDIKDDDVVLFDMVGAGESAEILKKKGYNVVGGGGLNDKIELDRAFGAKVMQEAGIQIPPSEELDSFEELSKYLDKNEGKNFVFKPNGNLETDLTLAGYSAEYLRELIPYLQERCPDDITFEIQEFVDGVEMSTEAWFNGKEFLRPINSTMEEKSLLPGGLGPAAGCMGNVVWYWNNEKSEKLYHYLFEGLEDKLRDEGYKGPIDINGIWNDKGIFALEWTARFGYDAIQASSRLLEIPLGEFLSDMGSMRQIPVMQDVWSLAIRVSIPPYPTSGDVPNVPVRFKDQQKYSDNIYLSDVMYDGGTLYCAGQDGFIFTAAQHGRSIPKLQTYLRKILQDVELPSMQYREDIGDRVSLEYRYMNSLIEGLTG